MLKASCVLLLFLGVVWGTKAQSLQLGCMLGANASLNPIEDRATASAFSHSRPYLYFPNLDVFVRYSHRRWAGQMGFSRIHNGINIVDRTEVNPAGVRPIVGKQFGATEWAGHLWLFRTMEIRKWQLSPFVGFELRQVKNRSIPVASFGALSLTGYQYLAKANLRLQAGLEVSRPVTARHWVMFGMLGNLGLNKTLACNFAVISQGETYPFRVNHYGHGLMVYLGYGFAVWRTGR